ncbi:MAG: sugar phosphate isomerase/epimerase [Clostridia bacterium]|nr:sugar phosphate isomerase/epimerase [Clostridia bacterium]
MIISTDNSVIRNALGDQRALRLIREAGFDGVDYSFYDMKEDLFALPDSQLYARADSIRATAEDLGLCFPQSHAPFRYRFGEGKNSKNYLDIVRSFEFCARIGCTQMVIHTLKFPVTDRTTDVTAVNLEFLRGFLPYARNFNVRIGVENLFVTDDRRGCFVGHHGTPEQLNAFLDRLDDPMFVACCDLGHAAIVGTEPEAFIAGMQPHRLTMLHVQDTDYRHDSHTLPHLGLQHWDAVTSALAAMGYQGAMNLEVLLYYARFPQELYPAALKLAAETARCLAADVERKRGQTISAK